MKQPAYCQNCKTVFLSALGANLYGGHFSSNIQECPYCGQAAAISNSNNTAAIIIINLVLDPSIPRVKKRELAEILESLYNGHISWRIAQKRASRISKLAGDAVRYLRTKLLEPSVLIGLAALLLAYSDGKESSEYQSRSEQIQIANNELLKTLVDQGNLENSNADQKICLPAPGSIAHTNEANPNEAAQSNPNRKARRKAEALSRRREH